MLDRLTIERDLGAKLLREVRETLAALEGPRLTLEDTQVRALIQENERLRREAQAQATFGRYTLDDIRQVVFLGDPHALSDAQLANETFKDCSRVHNW